MLPRKGGFGVDGSSGGSGCFGTEFCFQGRERRLEQIRAKEKIKKKPKGGGYCRWMWRFWFGSVGDSRSRPAMELLGSAVRRKNGFGGFGGCERRMERLWSGVCWSVRGITVERGRKR